MLERDSNVYEGMGQTLFAERRAEDLPKLIRKIESEGISIPKALQTVVTFPTAIPSARLLRPSTPTILSKEVSKRITDLISDDPDAWAQGKLNNLAAMSETAKPSYIKSVKDHLAKYFPKFLETIQDSELRTKFFEKFFPEKMKEIAKKATGQEMDTIAKWGIIAGGLVLGYLVIRR